MARGRRHVRLRLVAAARTAAGALALLLLQGSSCLDLLTDDPDGGGADCCVVCADGQVACGDACIAASETCDEAVGCACPVAGSACALACTVEETCGFRAMASCVADSCARGEDRVAGDGDDCLTAAGDCGAAALCACPGGCAKLDECAGSEDPTCDDTCTTLVGQEPVPTFQENRCKIESSCEDLALCSQ